MKILKKLILLIAALLLLSGIGGYLYFEHKFTPSPNQLEAGSSGDSIPIRWIANTYSPIAALLLPVKIGGLDHTFYMQLDLGSPNTIFYSIPLKDIMARSESEITFVSAEEKANLTISIGKMSLWSKEFPTLDYGTAVRWDEPEEITIIGTIGTDLLEKKVIKIDYKEGHCQFVDDVSELDGTHEFSSFTFEKRKILLPATINQEAYKLLLDMGTSGFELITNEKIWKSMAKKGAKEVKGKANSWGTTLITHTIETETLLHFKSNAIPLSEVTYIEGTSWVQNLLMKFSGMGGMIGNKMFMNNTLILDCKNQNYALY